LKPPPLADVARTSRYWRRTASPNVLALDDGV
jgi:hypothetical protein